MPSPPNMQYYVIVTINWPLPLIIGITAPLHLLAKWMTPYVVSRNAQTLISRENHVISRDYRSVITQNCMKFRDKEVT